VTLCIEALSFVSKEKGTLHPDCGLTPCKEALSFASKGKKEKLHDPEVRISHQTCLIQYICALSHSARKSSIANFWQLGSHCGKKNIVGNDGTGHKLGMLLVPTPPLR